jgi:hypothetical protein
VGVAALIVKSVGAEGMVDESVEVAVSVLESLLALIFAQETIAPLPVETSMRTIHFLSVLCKNK